LYGANILLETKHFELLVYMIDKNGDGLPWGVDACHPWPI
jgi:hypothetical protein